MHKMHKKNFSRWCFSEKLWNPESTYAIRRRCACCKEWENLHRRFVPWWEFIILTFISIRESHLTLFNIIAALYHFLTGHLSWFYTLIDSLNSEDDYELMSTTVTNVWALPVDPKKKIYLHTKRQDSVDTNATETIELANVR